MFEEENELDYEKEEVEEQEDDLNDNEKMKRVGEEEAKIWKKGGWKVDPRVQRIPGTHLIDPSAHLLRMKTHSSNTSLHSFQLNTQKMSYY